MLRPLVNPTGEEVTQVDDFARQFLYNALDKQDVALLYRALRDQIKDKLERKVAVSDEEYQALGKLKIALNII